MNTHHKMQNQDDIAYVEMSDEMTKSVFGAIAPVVPLAFWGAATFASYTTGAFVIADRFFSRKK